ASRNVRPYKLMAKGAPHLGTETPSNDERDPPNEWGDGSRVHAELAQRGGDGVWPSARSVAPATTSGDTKLWCLCFVLASTVSSVLSKRSRSISARPTGRPSWKHSSLKLNRLRAQPPDRADRVVPCSSTAGRHAGPRRTTVSCDRVPRRPLG